MLTARARSLGKRVERIKWRSTEVVILPGKTFTFPVLVTHKGSMLGWRFETKEHDIAFSLHLQQEDGTCTQIVPTTRYDAHLETVYATGRVEKTGTCVFTWDNSYSWWNAKQLVYSIELTFEAPEVDDAQAALCVLDAAAPRRTRRARACKPSPHSHPLRAAQRRAGER